ncbi:MAG TPA: GNAT family N-acetyltransferase [Ktedonobacterales bacterium]|jgi:ribosomal-protein-alanine N-acetyltransferase
MARGEALRVRDLAPGDVGAVQRLLQTSDHVYRRFTTEELPHVLATYPALGLFSVPPGPLAHITAGTLQAYLLINALVPPSAWIGGFGVVWSASERFADYLDLLLPALERAAARRGAGSLYYSGNDMEGDWLRAALEARGFRLITTLRSYDKDDSAIPTWGNPHVVVRPFVEADLPGVLAVEEEAFAQLWRHDAAGFLEVNQTYPYFVVAGDATGIVGYQFNAVDSGSGYLVRIAVHPRAAGQGIGTRLMAEAIRYFSGRSAHQILLNTEETNYRARRLYERFGFSAVPPHGFVLGKEIQLVDGVPEPASA